MTNAQFPFNLEGALIDFPEFEALASFHRLQQLHAAGGARLNPGAKPERYQPASP